MLSTKTKTTTKTNTKIDLNIDNYELQDILNLFKIPIDFDENELKNAKKMVLKTHPDKSGLHADYFRFYTKAYKSLYEIWSFRKKGDVNATNKNTEYIQETDLNKGQILDNLLNDKKVFKNNKEFNVWFNASFEKHKLYYESEETGYGDWLKNQEEPFFRNDNVTMATMGEEFERKKREMRSLVVKKDFEEIDSSFGGYNLSSQAPSKYDSDIFSSLPYQDLHSAHTETVIPVTREDYERKQKFQSTDEYIQFRGHQDQVVKPLSEIQAQQYLRSREKLEEQQATKRAYDLAKQTEQAQKNSNMFWKDLQRLTR